MMRRLENVLSRADDALRAGLLGKPAKWQLALLDVCVLACFAGLLMTRTLSQLAGAATSARLAAVAMLLVPLGIMLRFANRAGESRETGFIAHVLLAGAPVGGWMKTEKMLIGSRQLEARYLLPGDCRLVNRYENELDVYLMPMDDLSISPLLIHLDRAQARYVEELAVWPEEGWTMLYSEEIPGGVGFVHTEQLEAVRPLG